MNGAVHMHHISKEDEHWRDLAISRERQINDLEGEARVVTQELSLARLEVGYLFA